MSSDLSSVFSKMIYQHGIDYVISVFSGVTQLRDQLVAAHEQVAVPFYFLPPEQSGVSAEVLASLGAKGMVIALEYAPELLKKHGKDLSAALIIYTIEGDPPQLEASCPLYYVRYQLPPEVERAITAR